ncbi:hypothetical protein GCM10023322_05950 [Rugosimonospora acidiphila]|uniref:Choice-of-anchor A domain-containing protein n=1 Tax=Rugosimonospora acidiphila TaxID=556531 RepID=A0ABP9RIS9_9ACTN
MAAARRSAPAATVLSLLAGLALAVPPAAPEGRADRGALSQAALTSVGPVNPVAPALSFGVMTEGNANVVNDENEGTMAVGGDLTFGNYQLAGNSSGSFVVPGDANPSALVVGGSVNFAGSVPGSRLQILSGGYAKVGNLTGTFVRDTDNNSAAVNTRILPANNYDAFPRVELTTRQPVPSVGPTSPINFGAAFSTFRTTSTSLGTCGNTVVLRNPNGDVLPRPIPPGSNAVVTLDPGVTNVLNLSAADLNNIAILTFANQPNPTTPLLVNVDTSGVGNNYAWTVPNMSGIGGTQAQYVMFNFPTATTLTLTAASATVEGTIYAPNAALIDVSPTNTEGSIITRTLDHRGGEIHYFPFSTTLSCGGAPPASIAVVKSSTTTSISTVGQQVPYSFWVANNGEVPLTNVNLTDTQTPPSSNANLGPIACPSTTLAPGESMTCTATYTVTQADLDNDSLSDTAIAHGTPTGTTTPIDSPPSDLTIPAAPLTASISLVKSSTTRAIVTVGQQVPYSFLVTNTGGLTLNSVNVTDTQTPPSSNANLGPITCPATTLAPGASTTCTATYTVTQADLDNDAVSDTAIARGTPTGTTTPIDSPPSDLTIEAAPLIAQIAVMKSSSTATITAVGQQVPYSFLVVNVGNRTLGSVNVTDTQTPPSSNVNLGPITCPATTLAPGESTTCTATYTVTQADLDNGSLSDTVIAHGTPNSGPTVDSGPSQLTIPATAPQAEITVAKSSTTRVIGTVGQQVPYTFWVVNTGGVTLNNVSVTDTQTPPSSNANLGPITCPSTTLAPSELVVCTATYTVTQADLDNESLADVAVAHGTPTGTTTPIDSPPADLDIPAAGLVADITVVKTSTTNAITTVGQQVPYTFRVVNTGSLTLNNVNVTDTQTPPSSNANLGPITCLATSLAPGVSTTCSATYTITQADLDNELLADVAVAHGTPTGTTTPIDSPPADLDIPAAGLVADITVVKTSTTAAVTAVGQQVPYAFQVVNTGGLTLTGVAVNDIPLTPALRGSLGPITCGPTDIPNGQVSLAPGETIECRATYTVTQNDFDHTMISDVATATGIPPSGPAPVSPPSAVNIPVFRPAIALTKSVDPGTVHRAGDHVTYTFLVSNTGTTVLRQVAIDETSFSGTGALGPITCGAPPVPSGSVALTAGASVACTADYAVTQADIDAGSVANTAVAIGTPPDIPGQPPSQPVRSNPSSAVVTGAYATSITVRKSSTTTEINAPGQRVPFTYTVTNTGDATLTGVRVDDTLTAPAQATDLGPITCGPTGIANGSVTLAAGASITCQASYTVSKADYSRQSLRDVATVTGTPPSGPPVTSPESVLTIPVKGKLPITGYRYLSGSILGGLASLVVGAGLVLLVRRRRAHA